MLLFKFCDFFTNGSVARTPSLADLVLLGGWKESTLQSYNCAVKKFKSFCALTGEPLTEMPVSSNALERFCVWAGRNAYSANHQCDACFRVANF
ncbi:hypothetical protein PtB15_1B759 [Puccinia triticina]|nr:hypothetical protein PtB15_1B759 [Puccinia triticina]